MSAKRVLTGVRAPDERAAEHRAWEVVSSAYRAREPSTGVRSKRRAALVLAVAVAVGAVALSPAGATVRRLITRALGVQHASPTLFSLPAPGRLLISGLEGTWSVAADGSTRRLGAWSQASWSPRGRYAAVAGGDQLAAIDPRGTPLWTVSRPAVHAPSWFAPSGYRVAYLSGHDVRVVAGDGTGDHLLAAAVADVAPVWRPGHAYQLAYIAGRGTLTVRDGDSGRTVWAVAPAPGTEQLSWSANGRYLLAFSPTTVHVYDGSGALISIIGLPRGAPLIKGALSPDGNMLALVLGGRSGEVVIEDLGTPSAAPRRVLAGEGLDDVVWSPNGRWLLVSWAAADQWVFIHVAGTPRIAAVSRIAQQFSTTAGGGNGAFRHLSAFPHLDGWCCTTR